MEVLRRIYPVWLLLAVLMSLPGFSGAASMALIPAGDFKMPVVLNKKATVMGSFYLDVHPVTNEEYLAFVKKHPEWQKSRIKKIFSDANYLGSWTGNLSFGPSNVKASPVVQVSWYGARQYCESQGKRLPTSDEWEYAALAPFKKETDMKALILEWYGKAEEVPLPPVMKKEPNIHGIYDLHGLIWEWVEDFNSSLVTGESRADGSLDKNMFCGAGAAGAADPGDYAAFMRFAFRSSLQANYTVKNLGFRCAKDKE